jgi:hypothetical protein
MGSPRKPRVLAGRDCGGADFARRGGLRLCPALHQAVRLVEDLGAETASLGVDLMLQAEATL